VLSKLNFPASSELVKSIVECQAGVVETFLYGLSQKIEEQLMKARMVSVRDFAINLFIAFFYSSD